MSIDTLVMANLTTLKNHPVLAAAGAPPFSFSFRFSWCASGAVTAGRENRKQMRGSSPSGMVTEVGPKARRMRRSGARATIMMMGKYKGTQMREKQLTEMIEKKVREAKEVCGEDGKSDECKVAWDEVEEVSQAKADLRLKLEIMHQDPLESFCQDNPETDECRMYED
ncbi:calvin cycle protein CP12-3, chloroplastic [Coffea eugenioides]|uniref:Calvin cycle protein CP12-2, chloroplastic n=1 Tax=Coffea arabica TaxID=13443 RepID=A0A6P6UNU9_COFAR|nr:calvin cycle protein CP12-3, chloroplastic [Coffea arabica]XP_027148385.1 calvin cycle protein CP12-3, chloroplastic [Coffea eugenioides]